jgi:hypothetical protein
MVMVMVIVVFLPGEHHRMRGWQAVKANLPGLKTIPFRVRFLRMAPSQTQIPSDVTS